MQCSGDSSSVCGGNRKMSVFGTKDGRYGQDLTCPVGYRRLVGTCIRRSYDEKTHNDAEKACLEEGATLVMPKTRELDLALRKLVSMEGYNLDYWIGLTIGPERMWEWSDGSLLDEQSYGVCH
ncbi:CD209 antigen-like protein A [Branchiostoma floridae x Branchiostoma belcheri]